MKLTLATIIVTVLAMIGLVGVPSAKANLVDKKTVITVRGGPIQVPSIRGGAVVLAPGKYVLKEVDDQMPDIIGIWNARETHIITTTHAIPVQMANPANGVVLALAERPGTVQSLKVWVYPGDTIGEEFVYPKTNPAANRAMIQVQPVPAS